MRPEESKNIKKWGHSHWLPWKVPEPTVLRPRKMGEKGDLRLELFVWSVGVASLWITMGPCWTNGCDSLTIGSLVVGPAWAQGVVEASAINIHKPCVVQKNLATAVSLMEAVENLNLFIYLYISILRLYYIFHLVGKQATCPCQTVLQSCHNPLLTSPPEETRWDGSTPATISVGAQHDLRPRQPLHLPSWRLETMGDQTRFLPNLEACQTRQSRSVTPSTRMQSVSSNVSETSFKIAHHGDWLVWKMRHASHLILSMQRSKKSRCLAGHLHFHQLRGWTWGREQRA